MVPVSTPAPAAVVLHIPHASLVVPSDVAADLLLKPVELEHELLVMTDHYTDDLFALPSSLATTVAFPASRLVVDPERFTEDACEPMARKGMGVVYTCTASGQPLRRPPSADQRQRLLTRFYDPHHAALTTAVEAALAAHGTCLLVDGHSFPTHALPYEDDQDPDSPDICIGTDSNHTPAWLCDIAVSTFEELGWSVAVDRPFSGALVPTRFYRKDPRVRAIMVEVKRGLYMDEQSGARLPRFDEVRERLSGGLGVIAVAGASRHDGS
jgi:N-formylglutamate amidohydrolase